MSNINSIKVPVFNFLKKHKKKILYGLGMSAVGLLTFRWLFQLSGGNYVDIYISVVMAIVYVSCNVIFFTQSLNPKKDKKWRGNFKRYWIISMSISIFGATIYLFSSSNELWNDVDSKNNQYTVMKEEKVRLENTIKIDNENIYKLSKSVDEVIVTDEDKKKTYDEYDKKIKSKESEFDTKINKEKKDKASAESDASWCRHGLKDEGSAKKYDEKVKVCEGNIKNLETQKKDAVQKLQVEKDAFYNNKESLSSTNAELLKAALEQKQKNEDALNAIDLSKYKAKVKSTKGLNAILEGISNVLPIPIAFVSIIINILLSICFELFVCKLYYLSQDEIVENNKMESFQSNVGHSIKSDFKKDIITASLSSLSTPLNDAKVGTHNFTPYDDKIINKNIEIPKKRIGFIKEDIAEPVKNISKTLIIKSGSIKNKNNIKNEQKLKEITIKYAESMYSLGVDENGNFAGYQKIYNKCNEGLDKMHPDRITDTDAKKAIGILEDIGVIEKVNGRYQPLKNKCEFYKIMGLA